MYINLSIYFIIAPSFFQQKNIYRNLLFLILIIYLKNLSAAQKVFGLIVFLIIYKFFQYLNAVFSHPIFYLNPHSIFPHFGYSTD